MADFSLDPDVVLGLLDGGGGSGGSSGETFGPMQFDPNIGKYVQIGSRGTVRVVGGPAQTVPQGADPRDLNGDGLDDSTGRAVGVYAVPTSVSPTGFVYNNIPVWPNGAPYTGAGAEQDHPGYSNVKAGSGGMFGINNATGRYELIPGSEALGSTAPTSGPVGGGGGGSSGSAYSGIATQMLANQGALARIEAESAAQQARMQMEAQLTKELKALDQNFQREMAAMQNTLSAIGLQAQIATANAQLRQAYEQNKIALVGQFQSALQQYDARAVFDAMMEAGSLSSALNQMGEQGFLTDNANAPAAALLSMIRKPFEPIPEPTALAGFLGGAPGGGMTGGLPGGATGGTGGATGGTGGTGGATGGTGGLSGGLGGASQIGSAVPFTAPNADLVPLIESLRAAGATDADIAQLQAEIASGQRSAQDFMLGNYYKSMTGNSQFLRNNPDGSKVMPGGDLYGGSGYMPDTWQTTDPLGGNYNPALIPPPQPTGVSGMAGAGGTFAAPTAPIPANHPLAGGLTGGQVAKNPLEPQAVIPMLKDGGSFRGAAVVGEAGPELMIAPQGADVIPLSPPMAGQLLGSGMPGLAFGTLSGGTLTRARSTPTYVEPAPAPTYVAPTATTGGSVTTSVPSTTTQAAPPLASPVVSPTSSPAPPVAAPTPAAPAATTTPAQPATQPTTTPTTPLNGSLPQPSQELLDEIMADRVGTANMGINPYDVGFANLPPWIQELFFQNEAQRTGTPAALYAQDVARRQLSGAMVGSLGY